MNLLGIDIGGTKIAGGIVDAALGTLLHSQQVPTNAFEGGDAVLERAINLAQNLFEHAKTHSIEIPQGIGVGAGGQIDSQVGVVVAATDILPGWAGIQLQEAFTQRFSLPVAVDNDVHALAVGEHRFGASKGLQSALFLALGTGVGGGIISSGKLHHGANGTGGELGHLILIPDGLPCTCGGRGCLEQYVSGPALQRRFHEMGGDIAIAGVSIAELARRAPDSAAARAVSHTGYLLGVGIVSLANIFGPERIIIGGGLASLGDLLLSPARQILRNRALPGVRDVPILPAALGADAAIIGAASLVLER